MADLVDVQNLGIKEENPAGAGFRILWAPYEWFETIQQTVAPTAATTPEEAIKISTDHVFKTGFGWVQLFTEPNSQEPGGELVGGAGSKTGKVSVSAHTPGRNVNLLYMQRITKAKDCIAIVEHLEGNGIYEQYGTPQTPAKIMGAPSNGKQEDGQRGVNWTIEAYQPNVILYEPTAIPLYSEVP